MSMTAQRKDLSDPEVINEFARRMGDVTHLDYLYVLTVADINATNNELWNSWRASLLRQLYTETRRALRRGLENPIDREERIEQTQQEAIAALERKGIDIQRSQALWARLGDDYFLREDGRNIARHTQAILEHGNQPLPLIIMNQHTYRAYEGATEIFIYTANSPNLFGATVAALDQLHLSVQDARIIVTDNGYTLNTYTVLTEDNQPLADNPDYMQSIQNYLLEQLDDPDDYTEIIQRRVPRQLKLFPMKTSASLSTDPGLHQTVLEIFTADRPGLLARIGNIFSQFGISVHKAKIANVAERVEDFFYITDTNNQPLTDPDYCNRLTDSICKELDEHMH
jgi:[protein-PII] uridylyltransferase